MSKIFTYCKVSAQLLLHYINTLCATYIPQLEIQQMTQHFKKHVITKWLNNETF